jgi:hypothetical protein
MAGSQQPLEKRRGGGGVPEERDLIFNPYLAPPGKFPQPAALGPKTCQDSLLEAERCQPENSSPRKCLWKKEGWVANDFLSALREYS